MFGRHLEVNLVKNKKATTQPVQEEVIAIDYAALAEDAITKALIATVTVMGAYFVLSTARHLIIQSATKPTD